MILIKHGAWYRFMLRLYKYAKCSEYTDFPNHLFRSADYDISYEHENDKVIINEETYKISTILHLTGSGSNGNSIESSLFQKIKTNVKLAFQSLFKC